MPSFIRAATASFSYHSYHFCRRTNLYRRPTEAGVEQAQAAYRQSLAQYEKAVLVSYQETEDQLSALHFLDQQSQSQSRAVVEAKAAEDIAVSRYKGGLVSYLDVVFAEQTVLANEPTEAQIAGDQMVASVVLIKTLGGGWNGATTP